MALKWGIASTGKIANDFVTALKSLSQKEHQVVAVAARSLDSSEEFAKNHKIPNAYEGYVNLATDPKVQVVYIGVLNPQHYDVAKLMLQHNKHVLVEKPLTLNEKQTRSLIELARNKKLFLMEAVWSRFFPVYKEVAKLIKNGIIGDVRFVSVTFGFPISDVPRVTQKNLGGSATLDIGVYILQFQQLIFRGLKPESIVAAGHLNNEKVDVTASAIFKYPDNKTAVVTCDATAEMPNEGLIVGTKGVIKIPKFWAPTSYKLNEEIKEFPLIENEGKFNYFNSAGLAYQAMEVRQKILEGKIESDIMPHEESIQLANWMDFVRSEIGADV
ncbi:unnamed protein product [Ceutorhynchus assimilis]|uniref:Trans-1,2-dihydrobenzene-1,2-diol dehydrogenase n=1 Tax=Ceutorhynchus assimilis TaxID=467358 RepID=A0A9N9MMR5_9CUCU|nr:unnamed protein product [Ceutorhynchus assimilis]